MKPGVPENHSERLSLHLNALAESAKNAELTLAELMARLEGRVYTLLLVLLSLPFCQPIALPGVSTPFGVVIALLGVRFAFRQKPWLPRRLLQTRVPARVLPTIMRGAAKLLGWLERFLHPRGVWLFDFRITQLAAGLVIAACGLLLLVPLPIPFSNLLPAITVVFLAASFTERDALMLALGGAAFIVTLAFFTLIFFGGVEFLQWLEGRFAGIFHPGDNAPVLDLPHR